MLCIIIQDSAAYFLLVLLAECVRLHQSLENIQVVSVKLMALAVVKKHAWLCHPKVQNLSYCRLLVHHLFQAVIHSNTVSALLVILEKNGRV